MSDRVVPDPADEFPDRIVLGPEASARLAAMMLETDEYNARVGVEGESMARLNVVVQRERLRDKRGVSRADGKADRVAALLGLLLDCDLGDPIRTRFWRDAAAWVEAGGPWRGR